MTCFRACISKVIDLFSKASKKNVDCEIGCNLLNAFAGSCCRANWKRNVAELHIMFEGAYVKTIRLYLVPFVKSQEADFQMFVFKHKGSTFPLCTATQVKNTLTSLFSGVD